MLAGLAEPQIVNYLAGGAFAKETRIPAGHVLVQHRHVYDHLSILASGVVEVESDGVSVIHEGPKCITIKAGTHHGVKALTDAVWYCIHATADADEEALIIEADRGQMEEIARGLIA